MKKYTFRLQTVLDMREKALEERRLDMAKTIKQLSEQNEQLYNLMEKKGSTRSDLEALYQNTEALDIFSLTNYKNYLSKVDNDIRTQEEFIVNTKKVLSAKQFEVMIAHKKVKVLETLKDKQEEKYYKNIEHKEAMEIDDIATTRYKTKAI